MGIRDSHRALCLLEEVFKYRHGQGPEAPFLMSPQLRSELFALALLAPCVRTNLRAAPPDELVLVDASLGASRELQLPFQSRLGLR